MGILSYVLKKGKLSSLINTEPDDVLHLMMSWLDGSLPICCDIKERGTLTANKPSDGWLLRLWCVLSTSSPSRNVITTMMGASPVYLLMLSPSLYSSTTHCWLIYLRHQLLECILPDVADQEWKFNTAR